jgi:DNA-directed RNA polymerase specialized sigma24 family protein
MKIPPGMTENEVVAIIQKISKKFGQKYAFAYYAPEDIEQECFIIACEGLNRYNGSKPLENFLSVHIRNRLFNLKRKKLKRSEKETNKFDRIKRLIVEPIDIYQIDDEKETNMRHRCENFNNMSYNEMMTKIDNELEVDLRLGFLRLLEGKSVSKFQREKIVDRVKEILSE